MQGRAEVQRRFRRVMSHFATGVTVVTGLDATGSRVGFTANAFTSVSLEPPLLLVCAEETSKSLPVLKGTARFAVSVLGEEQRDIALRFAHEIRRERFRELDFETAPSGLPILQDALAWMDCRVRETFDVGDHVLLIGEVLACEADPHGRPLVFFRGGFGTTGT